MCEIVSIDSFMVTWHLCKLCIVSTIGTVRLPSSVFFLLLLTTTSPRPPHRCQPPQPLAAACSCRRRHPARLRRLTPSDLLPLSRSGSLLLPSAPPCPSLAAHTIGSAAAVSISLTLTCRRSSPPPVITQVLWAKTIQLKI